MNNNNAENVSRCIIPPFALRPKGAFGVPNVTYWQRLLKPFTARTIPYSNYKGVRKTTWIYVTSVL